jgi:tRNA threonylcarbamoyladenosine biosynthesis protein TsaB
MKTTILSIDTSKNNFIKIGLTKNGIILRSIKVPVDLSQAEKLLPSIDKILKEEKISKKELSGIKAADTGDSFTSLRIGAATANALGFALGLPVSSLGKDQKKKKAEFDVIAPKYDREPNITQKKKKNVD